MSVNVLKGKTLTDRTTGRPQSFYSSDGLPGVCHIPMEPGEAQNFSYSFSLVDSWSFDEPSRPAFCPTLRALVAEKAKELGFPVCEGGTVVTIQGPR